MRNATRGEDDVSRPDREVLLAHADHVVAVEDVEELVLVGMDMQRSVRERRNFLEERESAAALLGRDANENRQLTEDEALA